MPFDLAPLTETQTFKSPAHQWLWDGAQVIRKYGHRKHVLGDVGNGFCYLGSLYHAAYFRADVCALKPESRFDNLFAFQEYRIQAARLLCDHLGLAPTTLLTSCVSLAVEWNNAPERTAEEVVAAMEGAALS